MTTQNKIEKMEIENNLSLEIRNDVLIVTNKETYEESRYEIESQEYEGRMVEVLAFVETLVNNVTNLEIRVKESNKNILTMVISIMYSTLEITNDQLKKLNEFLVLNDMEEEFQLQMEGFMFFFNQEVNFKAMNCFAIIEETPIKVVK